MDKQKSPQFPFYYRDWWHATRRWNAEQKIMYLEMLCEQADSSTGSIPVDLYNEECKDEYVRGKFNEDDNGFFNERMRNILNKRDKYRTSRIDNLKGVKNDPHMASHMGDDKAPHMDNDNDKDIDKEKDKNKGEIIKRGPIPTFSDYKYYAIAKKPNVDLIALKLKYESWIENGWRDGNDKPIVNWKVKLLNTLPYIGDVQGVKGSNMGGDPLPEDYGKPSPNAMSREEYLNQKKM